MERKTLLQNILGLAGDFVVRQKGVWSHSDWERLLEQAAALGMEMSDESKRGLGNLIEACRTFYGDDSACEEVPISDKVSPKPKRMTKPLSR